MKKSITSITLIIFAASMFGSLLNYLFQVISAYFLSVEDYGILNTSCSVAFPFILIFTPVQNYIVSELSVLKAKGEDSFEFITYVYGKFCISLLLCALIPALIVWIISSFTSLKPLQIILTIINNIAVIPFYISLGIIQSRQSVLLLCLASIIPFIMKFFLGIFAAYLTNSATYVIFFLFFGILFSSLLFPLLTKSKIKRKITTFSLKKSYHYIFRITLVYLFYSMLQYDDIILVNYFCTEYDTGIYSSASVIGKAVMYLPAAIILVLFPVVSDSAAKGISSLSLLLKSLVLNLLLSGGGAFILFFTADWLIPLFFGTRFLVAIPIMKILGFVFLPLSMITILFTFFLAKQIFSCIYPLLFAIIIQIVTVYFYHDTLNELLITFFVSGLAGCVGFFLLSFFLGGIRTKRSYRK